RAPQPPSGRSYRVTTVVARLVRSPDADPLEILRRDAGYGSPALLVVPIGADALLAADDLVDRGEECGDARQIGTLGPGGREILRRAPLHDVEPLFVGEPDQQSVQEAHAVGVEVRQHRLTGCQ